MNTAPPSRTTRATTLIATALTVAISLPAVMSAQSPTLTEIAKREQERRKGLKAPTKVYTKDDLPKSTAPLPGAPGDAAAAPADAKPAPPAEAKPETAPAAEQKDEAWWRARMTQAREELRRNEMFTTALQSRLNALAVDIANRADPAQRNVLVEERQKAVNEMTRVSAEITAIRKQIADIEEEARAAGVPPGWIR